MYGTTVAWESTRRGRTTRRDLSRSLNTCVDRTPKIALFINSAHVISWSCLLIYLTADLIAWLDGFSSDGGVSGTSPRSSVLYLLRGFVQNHMMQDPRSLDPVVGMVSLYGHPGTEMDHRQALGYVGALSSFPGDWEHFLGIAQPAGGHVNQDQDPDQAAPQPVDEVIVGSRTSSPSTLTGENAENEDAAGNGVGVAIPANGTDNQNGLLAVVPMNGVVAGGINQDAAVVMETEIAQAGAAAEQGQPAFGGGAGSAAEESSSASSPLAGLGITQNAATGGELDSLSYSADKGSTES
jgi:hypothetical protein